VRFSINVPDLGDAMPRRGSWILRQVGRTGLRLAGWRFDGEIPNVSKAVVIVVPHTSNWDFPIGVLGMFAVDIRVSWLGKHTLFRGLVGSVMRWLGGIAIDRTGSAGVVEQIVELFDRSDQMLLGLSPEGTRSRVERWKTGFYHIANGARIPIVPIAFNWASRTIRFGPVLRTTGQVEEDIEILEKFFEGAKGKKSQGMARPGSASGR